MCIVGHIEREPIEGMEKNSVPAKWHKRERIQRRVMYYCVRMCVCVLWLPANFVRNRCAHIRTGDYCDCRRSPHRTAKTPIAHTCTANIHHAAT